MNRNWIDWGTIWDSPNHRVRRWRKGMELLRSTDRIFESSALFPFGFTSESEIEMWNENGVGGRGKEGEEEGTERLMLTNTYLFPSRRRKNRKTGEESVRTCHYPFPLLWNCQEGKGRGREDEQACEDEWMEAQIDFTSCFSTLIAPEPWQLAVPVGPT